MVVRDRTGRVHGLLHLLIHSAVFQGNPATVAGLRKLNVLSVCAWGHRDSSPGILFKDGIDRLAERSENAAWGLKEQVVACPRSITSRRVAGVLCYKGDGQTGKREGAP